MATASNDDYIRVFSPLLDTICLMKEATPFHDALAEIKNKLLGYVYVDAWDFVDAVWNLFSTATVHNRCKNQPGILHNSGLVG